MMIKGVKFVGRTDETVHRNTKTHLMQEEINDFIDALSRFVSDKLRMETDMTYCQEAVKSSMHATISSMKCHVQQRMNRKISMPLGTFAIQTKR